MTHTVHHDAVTHTVHHDACVGISYPDAVYYTYKCTNCGALTTDSPPTCHWGWQSGNFGVASCGDPVEVVLAPAYDEVVVDTPAYDELVIDTPAYDETVVDTPAYDEVVVDTPAYDECTTCGATK